MTEIRTKFESMLEQWVEIEGFDSDFIKLMTIEKIEAGKLVMSLTVQQKHCNVISTLHGGAIATLIDIVSSMAILTNDIDKMAASVSVEIGVTYSLTAPVGRKIYVEALVYKKGRNLAFTQTRILLDKEDGPVVASGSHTKFLPILNKSKL